MARAHSDEWPVSAPSPRCRAIEDRRRRAGLAKYISRPPLRLGICTSSLLVVVGLTFLGCGVSVTRAGSNQLRWAPPHLVDPTTITLGNGYTDTYLEPSRDYIVKLPKNDKLGGVTLEGGHNIVIIGGQITVPANPAPAGHFYDRYRTGLYIKGATGTVHVEGVLFRGTRHAVWDAIDINAPKAAVQLENIRAEGVHGGFWTFHADVVQPWGGVRALRIDYLTGTSNYQGLTLPIDEGPIGSAQVSHVNLRGLDSEIELGGHLIWLTTRSTSCRSYPVELTDVYVQPRPGLTLAESVWPQRGRPRRCAVKAVHGRYVFWPSLSDIRGRVLSGLPPGGSYVPSGVAGTNYVSPGYLEN